MLRHLKALSQLPKTEWLILGIWSPLCRIGLLFKIIQQLDFSSLKRRSARNLPLSTRALYYFPLKEDCLDWAGVVVSINLNVLSSDYNFGSLFRQLLSTNIGRQNAQRVYCSFHDNGPKKTPKQGASATWKLRSCIDGSTVHKHQALKKVSRRKEPKLATQHPNITHSAIHGNWSGVECTQRVPRKAPPFVETATLDGPRGYHAAPHRNSNLCCVSFCCLALTTVCKFGISDDVLRCIFIATSMLSK